MVKEKNLCEVQITTVEQFTLSIFNSAQEDNVFRFEVVHSGEKNAVMI